MASLTIHKGLQPIARSALLIIGQNRLLKKIPFASVSPKLTGQLDAEGWEEAVKRLPASGGQLPVHFNQTKLIAIPDASSASRHNSPANPHAITKEVKAAGIPKEATSLAIVLICPFEHALASVAAIARCFPLYSRKSSPPSQLKEVHVEIIFTDKKKDEVSDADISMLSSLAAGIRTTGRLIDTPANELTTDAFVEEALAIGKALGVEATVIKGEDLKERGFGGIYHVGKAAIQPPAFVVLTHNPKGAKRRFALVGKGIVYDTGGMQIKGKTAMPSMKTDMGGAAALLNAFSTLVSAGFSETLSVCLCIAENNISPYANKPDDIITLLSGKTVEITNTDAEGRLVLADGVYYAKSVLKADFILDMATLTGAQANMTGKYHAAVLTNDERCENEVCMSGRYSGDLVHPMVFCPDLHFPDLASILADCKNSNFGKMMGPPSAIAGHFIGANIAFGEGLVWAHVDMACCVLEGERGLGYGVALVAALLGQHTESKLLQLALDPNNEKEDEEKK